jgi:hypothetical protein
MACILYTILLGLDQPPIFNHMILVKFDQLQVDFIDVKENFLHILYKSVLN